MKSVNELDMFLIESNSWRRPDGSCRVRNITEGGMSGKFEGSHEILKNRKNKYQKP